jgi:hypothetical protein
MLEKDECWGIMSRRAAALIAVGVLGSMSSGKIGLDPGLLSGTIFTKATNNKLS